MVARHCCPWAWGQAPADVATRLARGALDAPEGSPLHREVTRLLGGKIHPPGHEGRREQFARVADELEKQMLPHLAGDGARRRLQAARGRLQAELDAARREGIQPFLSAGNSYREGADRRLFTDPSVGVRGLILVGATDRDRVADFSAPGAMIAAPGVGLPVARPERSTDRDLSQRTRAGRRFRRRTRSASLR